MAPWPSRSLCCGNVIRSLPACPCSRARSRPSDYHEKKVAPGAGTKATGNRAGAAALPNQTEPNSASGLGLCRGEWCAHGSDPPLGTGTERRARAGSGAARALEGAHHASSPCQPRHAGQHDDPDRHRCGCVSPLCPAGACPYVASRSGGCHGQSVGSQTAPSPALVSRPPLPSVVLAALLAGPEPKGAGLEQAENLSARGQSPTRSGAGASRRQGLAHDYRQGRTKLVSPLSLCPINSRKLR